LLEPGQKTSGIFDARTSKVRFKDDYFQRCNIGKWKGVASTTRSDQSGIGFRSEKGEIIERAFPSRSSGRFNCQETPGLAATPEAENPSMKPFPELTMDSSCANCAGAVRIGRAALFIRTRQAGAADHSITEP
jgi:hypothetical protein